MITDELTDRGGSGLEFEAFVRADGERVRRALVAFYGVEIGTEAASEALVLAWQRWDDIRRMDNPAGFLFRVGQSSARPHLRWSARRERFPTSEPAIVAPDETVVDVLLALRRLRPDQRAAVILVKSFGYSHKEVAELLDVSESAVNNLVHRSIQRLRRMLETS